MQALVALLSLLALLPLALSSGFTTYIEIDEGQDNSASIAYRAPHLSSTLFVYVQIQPGAPHTQVFSDFTTLCDNYAGRNISVIPRVRYGDPGGAVLAEPRDPAQIDADVRQWVGVLSAARTVIDIPIVQAGFLGRGGEWHDGPFCAAQGRDGSAASLAVKRRVVRALQAAGAKVALRYPSDHHALFANSSAVTLHDDCIFADGPAGDDEGTYPTDGDQAMFKEYARRVAGDNGFGGEPCQDTASGGFGWDTATVCSAGSNGLIAYINRYKISYLNVSLLWASGKVQV